MSDDKNFDLPSRNSGQIVKRDANPIQVVSPGLTEKQQTMVIEQKTETIKAAARVLGDVGNVVLELVAIQKIRANSEARIGEIDAYTRHQVDIIRAQIDKTKVSQDGIRARGQEIRAIISEVSGALAIMSGSEDADARFSLIDALPELARLAVEGSKD